MRNLQRLTLGVALWLAGSTLAFAQDSRVHATLKAGATVEDSEDGLTGTKPAVGVALGIALHPAWRLEGELWVPGYLEDANGDPKHRDVLASVAAVRLFRDRGARPYVLAGYSLARVQDWFNFCSAPRTPPGGGPTQPAMVSCDEPDVTDRRRERNDGLDGYFLVGGGVEIPVARRVHLVADVRLAIAPVSVLVRPGVGVSIGF